MNHLLSDVEVGLLLEREEGQFLEFKSLWDRERDPPRALDRRRVRDFIAENVAAFANADGGILLLGAEDDGTPSSHRYAEEAIADFISVPERRLRPPVGVYVQRAVIDGNNLLVFQVSASVEAVMVEGNGFPYRVGDRVVREPQEVINARKRAYRTVGYERRMAQDATMADLDLDLVRSFQRSAVHRTRSVEELLEIYGLVLPGRRGAALTNAALLLFARGPLVRWHPRAGMRFFRVDGTARQHGRRRNVTQVARVELPVAAAVPEAHRIAATLIRRPERLQGLFFREMPEYPDFVWQEGLVNAVAHRDYNDQTREIEVWFYDDRMEVLNPGDLVPPVTLEALRERRPAHASRNPLIVRVLVEAGVTREEGEGIPRMFHEMEASSLKAPEFSAENSDFRLVLRNEPAFDVPRWLEGRVPRVREHMRLHGAVTNAEYRGAFGLTRHGALRELRRLVEGGYLKLVGEGRGARYVPGRRLTLEE